MEEIGSLGNDSVYYSDDEYTYEDKSEDGQEDAECVTLPSSSNVIQNVDESGYNSRLSDVNRSGFTEHEDNSRVLDYIASEGITMKNSDFQVLDKEGVTLLMNKLVDDIAGLAAVEIPVAEALLRYCRWDREKVTDKFLVDSQKFLHEAGVDKYHEQRIKACEDNGFEIVGASQTRVSPSADEMAGQTFLCHICYDDAAKLSESFNMSCGHLFCKDCFGEYLRNQVSDGPSCVLACCPEIDCKCSVTSDIFRELLDGDSLKQYERYLLGSYIEASSRVFKYCPGVGCDKVIRGSGAVTVRCTCEECFCFSCGEEGHMPCNCKQVASWNEKCASESGSINWILVNTKQCPQCSTRIEKNQGCNHMTCKVCRHEFCWICMGNWREHNNNYSCNRYQPSSKDQEEIYKSKKDLDRYLHYYRRYQGHSVAKKFAFTMKAKVKADNNVNQDVLPWEDYQYLVDAVDEIIECRRVLQHTYILGFYLDDDTIEKNLFERHQELLEENTERLHGTVEHRNSTEGEDNTIDSERSVTENSTQVVNLTRVTKNFRLSLLAGIVDGMVQSADAISNSSSLALGNY